MALMVCPKSAPVEGTDHGAGERDRVARPLATIRLGQDGREEEQVPVELTELRDEVNVRRPPRLAVRQEACRGVLIATEDVALHGDDVGEDVGVPRQIIVEGQTEEPVGDLLRVPLLDGEAPRAVVFAGNVRSAGGGLRDCLFGLRRESSCRARDGMNNDTHFAGASDTAVPDTSVPTARFSSARSSPSASPERCGRSELGSALRPGAEAPGCGVRRLRALDERAHERVSCAELSAHATAAGCSVPTERPKMRRARAKSLFASDRRPCAASTTPMLLSVRARSG